MPKTEKHVGKLERIWAWAFAAGLLAFYFLYAYFRIDAKLVYQAQEPVFFFDWHFARDFFTYPGGLNELGARFYAQFFYYSWTGAAALVLLLGAIAWSTRKLIQSLGPDRPVLYLHWIPTILLFALSSDYNYPAALSLGLLWVLLGALAYFRLAFLKPAGRGLLFCLLQATLYHVTAGQVFLFSLLVVGYELPRQRRIVLAAFYAAFAALLPYVGAMTIFMVHLPDAYTTNLTLTGKYHLTWPVWTLYASFPLLVLVGSLMPKRKEGSSVRRSVVALSAQGVLFLALTVTAALWSYDSTSKRILLVDYYAQRQDWKNVLVVANTNAMNPDYIQYQANRALYHCGLLGDYFFNFIQHSGGKGLFLQGDMIQMLPLRLSDLFFDMGLVSEAQHWAHEAISVTGDSPWNIQRLVEANLLKGDTVVASKYLKMLDRTLWFRGWARAHRKFLADPNALAADPRLGRIQRDMPRSDFLLAPNDPNMSLRDMAQNPANKMAFEYYMTECLLDGDLSEFVKRLPQLNRLGYQRIPRHFEEAILVYLQLTGGRDKTVAALPLAEQTRKRFDDFTRILARHNGDKNTASQELLPFRDTYWFYAQYYFHPKGQ